MKRWLFVSFFITALSGAALSAATNLPDISVLGDLTAQTSTDEAYPDRNQVTLRGIELALQGYVYPEIRADVFLAMHRYEGAMEPEVCEASVSFLRFFFDGLGMQAGKIHIDFGKLNKIHQHERPFVDQPVALTNFFGPHGLVGEGAVLNYLFPLPFFLRFEGGVWWLPAHEHEHASETEESVDFALTGRSVTGRLWSGVALGDKAELEIGASGVKGNGPHYLEHQDEVVVAGTDVTLRYLPASHQRVMFLTEFFCLNRKVSVGTLDRFGLFSWLGVQFNKYWEAGVRWDWAENAVPERVESTLVSLIGGYRFNETTRLRMQYGLDPKALTHSGSIQFVFGLGPHSHPLQ